MQKISYIHQMNGFLARMSEDALPANAVMLYLILFKSFNRTCWQQEWMKFTIQQLMAFTHVGSPNTVYNMRSLLKDLGYIDYRQVPGGSRNQTEYRLLPLTTILPEATAHYASIANTANTGCSAIERSINEYANTEHSAIEHSINEHSAIEHSVNEYSVSEHSATKCANTEYSNYEHSANEYSVNETSPQKSPEKRYFEPVSPSKNECSKTERSGDHSVDHSVELSKTEHSPIVKEEDKTISTTHVTTATDQAEGKNKNKTPKTVNEFCATNKDYLLCLDAYRDYFQKEPPSADKVKLIRFLAEYGTDSTLKALDIMMRNKADSLSYCEGVLRRMQWQMDKAAARRPAPRPHSDWQGWKMA